MNIATLTSVPVKRRKKKSYLPIFRDPKTLTKAQLTDPDYAIKQIKEMAETSGQLINCSKCHHCR